MSELRKSTTSRPNQHRSHTADLGSISLRSTLITGIEALEVDTLSYHYRKLSELHSAADKNMTDFKRRAHCLKTDMDRLDDNSHINLQSCESQTQHELDSSTRDLKAGLTHEFAVKQALERQVKDLVSQLTLLRQQVNETAAQVNYLEEFCGTRRLK